MLLFFVSFFVLKTALAARITVSVSDIRQVSPSQIDVPFTANKSQSLEETFSFLLSQFDATEEGGWGTLSIATTLALALAKPDWIKDPENHTAKMVLKHAALDLVEDTCRETSHGRIAHAILAFQASCQDPEHFRGKNLTELVLNSRANHDFEFALGMLALCSVDRKISQTDMEQLDRIANSTLNPDTILDSGVLALLASIQCRDLEGITTPSPQLMLSLRLILEEQQPSGAFRDNFISSVMVMNLLIATGLENSPQGKMAYKYLADQHAQEASFYTNIFYPVNLLPILAGKSIVDVGDANCPIKQDNKDKESPEKEIVPDQPSIRVQFKILRQDEKCTESKTIVTLPKGSSVYDMMQIVAPNNERFRFTMKKFSFGVQITSIGGVEQDVRRCLHWMLHRTNRQLRECEAPAPEEQTPKGVQETFPDDGDSVIFYYRKVPGTTCEPSEGI